MEAILYAEIYLICGMIMGLLTLWSVRRQGKSAAEIALGWVFLFFLSNFVSNFAFTLVNRIIPLGPLSELFSYLFKTLYLITLAAGVLSWCIYAELSIHTDPVTLRRLRILLCVLMGVFFALAIVNLFTHWIYSFGEGLEYRRHFMFRAYLFLLLLVSVAVNIRLLRRLSHELDPARKSHFVVISIFPTCILLALILTFLGESIPVICVCMTMALLSIFVSNLRHQISVDTLTRVNNRQNLNQFMSYKLRDRDAQLWLLMIDVDHFKHINDTYGHLEGDRALETVSDVLKQACRSFPVRPFIARYGGDEFVVVLEGSLEDSRKLSSLITHLLEEENRKRNGYQLKVSIGISRFVPGMTYEQLLEESDRKLYQIKAAREHRDSTSP